LTPAYLYDSDATHFHSSIASRCNPAEYSRFKKWCDDYFYIKHRGERRGIGGIFFDDLDVPQGQPREREKLFAWVKSCGEGFVEGYLPIVHRRKNADFTDRMKQWQQLRRVSEGVLAGSFPTRAHAVTLSSTLAGAIRRIQSRLRQRDAVRLTNAWRQDRKHPHESSPNSKMGVQC
jgi:hypothetical protein